MLEREAKAMTEGWWRAQDLVVETLADKNKVAETPQTKSVELVTKTEDQRVEETDSLKDVREKAGTVQRVLKSVVIQGLEMHLMWASWESWPQSC